MKIIKLLSILLILSVNALKGQKKPTEVEFKIVTAAMSKETKTLYVLKNEIPKNKEPKAKDWLKIDLNIHSATQVYKVKNLGSLQFKKEPLLSADVVSQVKLKPNVKSWIFLLLPNKAGYRIVAVPEEKIGWSNYTIYNFTGENLNAKIGDTKNVIKHKSRAVYPSNNQADWVMIVGIVDGKSRILRRTKWRLNENQREIIIYYRKADGTIKGQHVIDHKADPQPQG